jgi:microcystin-dependent protein
MQLVRGMILIWRGEIKDIPQGWALCDGKNDTPDLSGRFVIGINPSDNRTESKDENDIQLNPRPYNSIGGRQTVTLSVEQMPNHSHQTGGNITSDMSGSKYGGIVTRYRSGLYTDAVGGNQPHDNMPPYYALAYIMKL